MTENKNYEEITLAQEVSSEEAEIIAKDTKDEIKYPFIIKYNATEKDNLITLIDKLGCDIVREMDFANCIAVSLNMKQLEYIKKSSSVTYVETNCTYNILDEEASRACAEYAIQHVENICKENDKKVKIAVFDTGVNKVEFKDAVCFVNEDKDSISNDHGTELIKIISSANENEEKVDIYSVKVCDENGCTTTDAVMSALRWAMDNGMHIVIMCFESTYRSSLLATMIKKVVKSGITIVTANSGTDITYPADFTPVSSAEVDNLTKTEEDDTIGVTTVMPRIAVVSDKTAVGYTLNSGISLLCEGDECPDNGGSGNGNTTTSSSNTMATAFDLPFGSVRSGCISLPYDEHWYRFVAGQRKCTIYSTGYTDVIGYLYDECGNQIASNDDYGGYNNFRINIDLTQGATYYIKVKAYGSTTGGYMVVADERRLPTSITVSPSSLELNVGETYALSASVTPNNASNKSVIWTSSDSNVATVERTGLVTAKLSGNVVITAKTVDGELVSTCSLKVEPVLSYPDTLIDDEHTKTIILRLMHLIDENERAYLTNNISLSTRDLVKEQLELECNIARADYISVGNNPTSDYAYEMLGGNPTATVPFSFSNTLRLGTEGLAVIVVQRTLEILGYLDLKDLFVYGKFDEYTMEAASIYPALLSYSNGEYVFDNASFNVLFGTTTISERVYEAYNALNKFKTIHNVVAFHCAQKVQGTYNMSDNKINNGNSSFSYFGYADILKDINTSTYIWEVKPNKPLYYKPGGVGDRQLQRYCYAGNRFEQNFSQPLEVGYILGRFTIPYLNKYINVDYCNNLGSSKDYRKGLILYDQTDEPKYELELEPVLMLEPSDQYEFFDTYVAESGIVKDIILVGIIVVASSILVGGAITALPKVYFAVKTALESSAIYFVASDVVRI